MSSLAQPVGSAFYGAFKELRPCQREAIRPILEGHDVLLLSPTGSGKTEAVLAPLIQKYAREMRAAAGTTILYITPTRALANDLFRRLLPALEKLNISVGIRHGEQNDLARVRKPNVLITTPESLDVLMVSGERSIASARAIVLDEIHLTYNTQRGFQTATLLRRLELAAGSRHQVIGLSATVADSKDIWAFFRPGIDPVVVREEGRKPLDYHIVETTCDQD